MSIKSIALIASVLTMPAGDDAAKRKLNYKTILLLVGSLALTACGGGGGEPTNTEGSGEPANTGGVVTGVSPVTPLTSSATQNLPSSVGQVTFESGFDGDIEVVTEGSVIPTLKVANVAPAKKAESSDFVTQTIQLKNGVSSINVSEIEKMVAIDISCNDGTNINGTMSSIFSTGKVDKNGAVNGQPLSCTSTFLSSIPTTISDEFSIRKLLQEWGTDDNESNDPTETGLLSTNCPQDKDGLDGVNPFSVPCDGSILTNYIVTDDKSGIHKVSTKLTFTSSSSSSNSSGGDSIGVTFSGAGISDLKENKFIPARFEAINGTFDTRGNKISSRYDLFTWENNDFTEIYGDFDTDTLEMYSIGVVSAEGLRWYSESAGLVGVSVTATEVLFNNVTLRPKAFFPESTVGRTPITLNGSLHRL